MKQIEFSEESKEQFYDGSLLLHAREIKRYWREFCDTSAKEMSLKELVRHLEFLEMCAISTELHYDGSIPEEYAKGVEEVQNEITTALKRETKSLPEITPLNYEKNEQRLELAVTAVEAAFRQICEVFDYAKQPEVLGEPIEEPKAEKLMSALRKARTEKNDSTRENIAMELIDKGPKDFWGGKFAAGIIHPKNHGCFTELLELLSKTDESIWPRLFPAIIHRFRTHLLSSWAAGKSSAYYPTGRSQTVCESYTRTFWQYILQRLWKEYGTGEMKDISRKEFRARNQVQLPLIGLEVLLKPEESHVKPKSLLAHAVNLSHQRGFKSFLQHVLKTQPPPAEWEEQTNRISGLLHDYGIERSPKDLSSLGKIYRWLAPPVISSVVTVLVSEGVRHFLGTESFSTISIGTGTAAGATVAVINYVLEKMWQENEQRGYISFMSHLLDGANITTKKLLANQVKAVWGKQLIFN